MFEFLKPRKVSHPYALTNQTIGGQSVLYRLFIQTLGVEDGRIRKLELTYFAASVTTFVYLHLSNSSAKEKILDDFSHAILQKSIPSSQESISLDAAIAEYQQRYAEYSALLPAVFDSADGTDPGVTLLIHLFNSVTAASVRVPMLQVALAAPLIIQYVADHVDFVRTKL